MYTALFGVKTNQPKKTLDNVRKAVKGDNVHMTVVEDCTVTKNGPVFEAKLCVGGADHPDLIASVATAVADEGVQFSRMRADSTTAPFGGATLFEMRADLTSEYSICEQALRARLDELADELALDIDMTDARQLRHSLPDPNLLV